MRFSRTLVSSLILALASTVAFAQTTTPAAPTTPEPPAGFVGSAEAVAVHYAGAWSAGTVATESYDFIDFGKTKSNHLFIDGQQDVFPAAGLDLYLAGVSLQPDLSKLLNKTNVQPGSFNAFVDGALGNGVPATGGSHISYRVGGGVKYQLTSSLTWQSMDVHLDGFGGAKFADISTGLSFAFTTK